MSLFYRAQEVPDLLQKRTIRNFFIAAFVLYGMLITYLSLAPLDSELNFNIWDKASHIVAYVGLAVLSYLVSTERRQLAVLLMACFCYGIIIELLQGLTSYRFASWLDQLANTIGLLLGYCVMEVSFRFSVLKRYNPIID